MKLKKTKTCNNCIAIRNSESKCELGFNNIGKYDSCLGIHEIKPQEKCPKPLTIEQYLKCKNESIS